MTYISWNTGHRCLLLHYSKFRLPKCNHVFYLVKTVFLSQLVSIITDETPIEQMRNRLVIKDRGSTSSSSSSSSSRPPHQPSHTRKPKLALLREVFGRGAFVFVTCTFHPACTILNVRGVPVLKPKLSRNCSQSCVAVLEVCKVLVT